MRLGRLNPRMLVSVNYNEADMYLLDIWEIRTVLRSALIVECIAAPITKPAAFKLWQILRLGIAVVLEP